MNNCRARKCPTFFYLYKIKRILYFIYAYLRIGNILKYDKEVIKMAYKMTKRGSLDNEITYEFICDTVEDMNAIEDRYKEIGSIAIVL